MASKKPKIEAMGASKTVGRYVSCFFNLKLNWFEFSFIFLSFSFLKATR